jgi:hypothetical protein
MRPGLAKTTGIERCIVEFGLKKRLVDLQAIPSWLEAEKRWRLKNEPDK